MRNTFRNILVPVDFSINTDVAIKKAMEFSGEETVIHLLHIQSDMFMGLSARTYQFLINNNAQTNRNVVENNLQRWKWQIEESTSAKVCTWLTYAHSVPTAIEQKAIKVQADLVIIGKSSSHSWLPFLNTVMPSLLAEKTGIPFLTVKPGSLHSTVSKVIVPVTSELSNQKMEIIDTLCHVFQAKIYLVTFMENGKPSDLNVSCLMQFLSSLQKKPGCDVEYAVLHGNNKARELLQFAESIQADMLLVNPHSETKIGSFNRRMSDVLPPESKVQVLAVLPND